MKASHRIFCCTQITWIDGLGNVLTTGIDYMKEPLADSRRFTAKSILKLTPKKEHHNTTFLCQAQNTADRTYRSAKLKLEVCYSNTFILDVSRVQCFVRLFCLFACFFLVSYTHNIIPCGHHVNCLTPNRGGGGNVYQYVNVSIF